MVLLTILFIFYGITWVLLALYFIYKQFAKPDGLLNIDQRDAEKDFYDFVFLTPTEVIPKKKNLKIEVHVKS